MAEFPPMAIGHQGLFFVRFDGASDDPPLTVGAKGLYYNRNRWYSPELGRFTTRDVNETAAPMLIALAFNGQTLLDFVGAYNGQSQYSDGMNLYLYAVSNSVNIRDPLGLAGWDEDIDNAIAGFYAERAEFLSGAYGVIAMIVQASAEAAAQAAIEGLVMMLVPGGAFIIGAYHAVNGAIDIHDNGLGWSNALELLGGAAAMASDLAKVFSRFRQARAAYLSEKTGKSWTVMCFVQGTQVMLFDGRREAIENIDVGMRVVSGPANPEFTQSDANVDPETWRTVLLEAEDQEYGKISICLLRDETWIDSTGAEPGQSLWLMLPEMKLHCWASVCSIEPCPNIAAGSLDGLVTGTFYTEKADVINIYFEDMEGSVGATPNHPFFLEDKAGWVDAQFLQVGDVLRTMHGTACIDHIQKSPERCAVYNLEINQVHTYYVGSASVLVHNTCTKAQVRDLAQYWNLTGPKTHPALGKFSHGQEWFTDGRKWFTFDVDGHHGGVWKVFDRSGTRLYTVDIDGNIVGG